MSTETKKKAALETRLHELECELQRSYSDIGKAILEVTEAGAREVNALVDRIIEVKKALSGKDEGEN